MHDNTNIKIEEIQEWLDLYARNSEYTKKRYASDISSFLDVAKIDTLEQLNDISIKKEVKAYLEYSIRQKWSNQTLNQRVGTLKLLSKYLNNKGYIRNTALEDIKRLKNDAEPVYTPTIDECNLILDDIKQHTKKKRLYVMTAVLLGTGLRKAEICNLKISDLGENQIRVFGKGSKVVNIPVSADIIEMIRDYIDTERKETMKRFMSDGGKDLGYVFVSNYKSGSTKTDYHGGNQIKSDSLYKQISHRAEKAGIATEGKTIGVHSMRHTYATCVYEQTGDLLSVQELLRHSSPATTKRYIDENKQTLRNIAENFTPLSAIKAMN